MLWLRRLEIFLTDCSWNFIPTDSPGSRDTHFRSLAKCFPLAFVHKLGSIADHIGSLPRTQVPCVICIIITTDLHTVWVNYLPKFKVKKYFFKFQIFFSLTYSFFLGLGSDYSCVFTGSNPFPRFPHSLWTQFLRSHSLCPHFQYCLPLTCHDPPHLIS